MNSFDAPYSPTPGSVAFKAIAFLERQPRGTELMSSRLAESIGVSPACIGASLEAARKYGAIFGRKKIDTLRAPVFWSLVDHDSEREPVVPPPASFPPKLVQAVDIDAVHLRRDRVIDMEPAAPSLTLADVAERNTPVRDSQQVLKAEPATADATDRETPAIASPVGGPVGVGKPAAAGPADGMRIALWSDGTLQIERTTVGGAAELVLLCRDETRQLVAYLDSIALEVVREGAA